MFNVISLKSHAVSILTRIYGHLSLTITHRVVYPIQIRMVLLQAI